jgi:hyperosmotically inducible periplasmic protein
MKKRKYRLILMAAAASVFLFSMPLLASRTDDRIESSARKTFVFKTFLKEDDIRIELKNGVATLTGSVADESHAFMAGDIVASLPGVTEVENKLKENGEAPAVNSDAWLTGKVKSLLLLHRSVYAAGTEVTARDGLVTLRGEAGSMAQKDRTAEYAKDVAGVKSVRNEMTVSGPEPEPGHKTAGAMDEAIDDVSITVLVEMTLLRHRSTSALNPIVQTKEGVVRLRGNARNDATKDLIDRYVHDVHGVKRVINVMSFE